MKYLSLFSGIGGFELGINQAYENNNRPHLRNRGKDLSKNSTHSTERESRSTCIGYSEIDKYAIQIYQKHFPKHKNYGDIRKIKPEDLPDFDLLVGGFPCQSFSIAGKRGGFEDARGTLFFEICRIIKEKQPRLLLLENVKGLLSHDKGNTFITIITALDELGYDCQWQVLNSKNFGVPQNRERVFIIGNLRGKSRPEVFPICGTSQKDTRNVGEDLSYALDANYHKGTNTLAKGRRQLIQLNQPTYSNDRLYSDKGISPTLNSMQGGNRQPFIKSKAKIRKLTPLECERLQGFPDGWTEGISDTQRYKCLGNAVTVNVIEAIIKKLTP